MHMMNHDNEESRTEISAPYQDLNHSLNHMPLDLDPIAAPFVRVRLALEHMRQTLPHLHALVFLSAEQESIQDESLREVFHHMLASIAEDIKHAEQCLEQGLEKNRARALSAQENCHNTKNT